MDKSFIKLFNLFNNSKLVQYCLFFSFTLISFLILREHVLYRDDARPMLIATYERSIADFFFSIRYDGGPILYHLILWIIAKFTPLNPFVIKLIHFITQVSILAVVIFLIRLPNIYRLLILLQIPLLGHLIFVRRYTITVLLILLFAYFYSKKNKFISPAIHIILFLLPQTCSHGLFISFGLFFFLLLNRWKKTKTFFHRYDLTYFISCFLCIVQVILPPDVVIKTAKGLKPIISEASLIYLIRLISDIFLDNLVSGIIFLLVILFILIISFPKRKFTVISSTLSVFIIFTLYFLLGALKYPSLPRHNWLIFYTIVSFLIILTYPTKKIIREVYWTHYFVVAITISSLYTFISYIPEVRQLSSQGKAVAEYLDKFYSDKEILTKYESFIESIIVYRREFKPYYSLGRHKHIKYFIANHESADFTKFKDFYTVLKFSDLVNDLNSTPDELLSTLPVVVTSSHLYEKDVDLEKVIIQGKYSIKFLADFNGAKYDNFTLYKIEKI